MNVCACVVVVFINKALLDYAGSDGNLAVGAYGIVNRTTMFFIMVVFGVTQGMQPILGFNYGANKWERVKRTLRIGIIAGVSITTLGFILTESFPDTISSLFTTDPTLIEIARNGFRIYFICYPVVGCQIVIQNFSSQSANLRYQYSCRSRVSCCFLSRSLSFSRGFTALTAFGQA